MERLTEGEKKVVLSLLQENRKSYYEIAKVTGLSIEGVRKIIKKLEKRGIVEHNPNSDYDRFVLRRDRVVVKKSFFVKTSSKRNVYSILKELLFPSLLGLIISFILSFPLKENSVILTIGGLVVFIPQFLYSFYKVLHCEEEIEVYSTS